MAFFRARARDEAILQLARGREAARSERGISRLNVGVFALDGGPFGDMRRQVALSAARTQSSGNRTA